MSIRVVAWVLDHCPAGGTDLLVMIAIADQADDKGRAFPSKRKLAHRARVSARTVQRSLRNLEEMGQLETLIFGSGRRSSRYRITFADPLPLDSENEGGQSVSPEGSQSVSPGETQLRPPRGDTATSPEPSLNLSTPPSPADAERRQGCAAHPKPRKNCRACGTSARALAAAEEEARLAGRGARRSVGQILDGPTCDHGALLTEGCPLCRRGIRAEEEPA